MTSSDIIETDLPNVVELYDFPSEYKTDHLVMTELKSGVNPTVSFTDLDQGREILIRFSLPKSMKHSVVHHFVVCLHFDFVGVNIKVRIVVFDIVVAHEKMSRDC